MIEAYRDRGLPASGYDEGMNTSDLLEKLRRQPANSRYRDLIRAVKRCGFVEIRQSGSHQLFEHPEHPRLTLNLQSHKNLAKPYQVRDFLQKVSEYNLLDA